MVGVSSALLSDMGHARPRPKRLAEKLLQIREALGLSQREMAERLAEQARVKITYKISRSMNVTGVFRILKSYLPMLALRMSQ